MAPTLYQIGLKKGFEKSDRLKSYVENYFNRKSIWVQTFTPLNT